MFSSPPRGDAAAGSRRAIGGLSILVVLLIGTTILPWQRAAVTVAAPSPVRVAKATVGDMKASISLNGELRPTDQMEVTPRVSGRVTRLTATVGRTVRAGEALAELDRTALEVALTQAQTSVTKERSALAKLQSGARAEDIVVAQAAVRAAEASLAQAMQGPKAEDVDMAVQKLNQARETRTKTASSLGNAKEQARIAVDQAMAELQRAQALYGASKLVYDEAVRTGKDPNVGSCPSDNKRCNDLTDIKLRSYKADFEAKEIGMRSAEAGLAGRQLAYEDAKRQEVTSLQIENSKIADALASLEKARTGPDADAVAEVQADLEAARARLAKAETPYQEPELQAAQASIQNAEAAVRLAEANLREATVVAPFAGIVTQRYVSVGSVVSSSTAIAQLVSTTLEAKLSADDSQVAVLEPGQKTELRLNAYPGVVFPAAIESISPSANQTSRTFTATAIPENADGRLKPGMLVQGDVAAINRPSVLMIPEQAVLSRGLETTVFTVVDGKARRKPVTLGVRGGGMVEVIEGVAAGESVVIDGQAALNDNDQVTIAG
jgi:HlyD family secretion protein